MVKKTTQVRTVFDFPWDGKPEYNSMLQNMLGQYEFYVTLPRNITKCHEVSRNSTNYHETSRNVMKYQEILGNNA